MNGRTAIGLLAATPADRAASVRVASVQAFAEGKAGRATARWAHARQLFWQEMHVELRRHAGNEHLPFGMRGSLRRVAQQAYGRAARLGDAASPRFPRRLLLEPFKAQLPGALADRARREAAQLGIDPHGANDDSVYRYDRNGLIEALRIQASRGKGR